jgi:hypothetical protein
VYAPWCPHCRRLTSVFDEVAATMAEREGDVAIAKLNADTEIAVGVRFMVTTFPTVLFITDSGSTLRYYEGPRDAESMVEYLRGGYIEQPPWCGENWTRLIHPGNPVAIWWRALFCLNPLRWVLHLVDYFVPIDVRFAGNVSAAVGSTTLCLGLWV